MSGLHSSYFCVLMAVVLWSLWGTEDTSIVKANNRLAMSCSSPSSSASSAPYSINHSHTATCILQQITFAVFTVAVATVLAKTLAVIQVSKARKPGRTMRRSLLTGAAMSFHVLLDPVIICGVLPKPLPSLRWTLTLSPRSPSCCATGP